MQPDKSSINHKVVKVSGARRESRRARLTAASNRTNEGTETKCCNERGKVERSEKSHTGALLLVDMSPAEKRVEVL